MTSPENVAAVRDDTEKARLQCKPNTDPSFPAVWHEKKLGTAWKTVTSSGSLTPTYVTEGYELDKTNEEFNLDVPVTSMDFAGDYRVEVVYPTAGNRYSQLTILGKLWFTDQRQYQMT